MTLTKIGSLVLATTLTIPSLFAMEMMDHSTSSMMKDDMKKGEMMVTTHDEMAKKSSMVAADMAMLEKVSPTSSKEEVTKIQMMLAEKGYLSMPKGAAYGYYGKRTKAAHMKYKKMSMMKDSDMMKTDTMKKDGAMKDDTKKTDTMMAH